MERQNGQADKQILRQTDRQTEADRTEADRQATDGQATCVSKVLGHGGAKLGSGHAQ